MSEWRETTLGEIAEIIMGQSPPSETCNNDGQGLPLLNGPTEFGDSHPFPTQFTIEVKKVAKAGDLLFCVRGSTTGRMNWADRSYSIGRGIAAIRSKNGIQFQPYIRSAIEHNLKNLLAVATGSTFPNISRDQLRDLIIQAPPENTKIYISNLAHILDTKIENLRSQNQTLEKIAQTLFNHWFIDFEFPNDSGEPYKSSGGAMVASELGDIPVGWRVGKLGDIVDVFTGYPFESKLYSFKSGIRVVRGENVSLGYLRWDTEKKWEIDIDLYNNYFLSENDYVIGMDGSRVGRNRTIILKFDLPLILAQRVARLRAYEKDFQGYVNILMGFNRFEKYVDLVKTGTSIPHISGQIIRDFSCIIPSEVVVNSFNNFYKAWYDKVSINNYQIQTLTKTRDTLLPKLMSGQIRVAE